jgi:hypothetical protein
MQHPPLIQTMNQTAFLSSIIIIWNIMHILRHKAEEAGRRSFSLLWIKQETQIFHELVGAQQKTVTRKSSHHGACARSAWQGLWTLPVHHCSSSLFEMILLNSKES